MACGGRRGETQYQTWERSTQLCAGAVVGLSRLAGVLSRLGKAASGDARRWWGGDEEGGEPRLPLISAASSDASSGYPQSMLRARGQSRLPRLPLVQIAEPCRHG